MDSVHKDDDEDRYCSVQPLDGRLVTKGACPSPHVDGTCTELLPGAVVVHLPLVDPGLVQHAGHLLSTDVRVPCLGLVWLNRAADGEDGHLVVLLPDLGGRAAAPDSHWLDHRDAGGDVEE